MSAALRVLAGTCAALWLVGWALCDLRCADTCHLGGDVFGRPAASPHHGSCAGLPKPVRTENTDDGRSQCCSTIRAFVQTAEPLVVTRSVAQPTVSAALLGVACGDDRIPLHDRILRQAKSRDWVFTPEVSLGPAFRSNGPPVFSDLNPA